MLYEVNKEDASPSVKSFRFHNLRYASKYFAQIYGAQYVAAMLMYIRGTLTWRPENDVNMWNSLFTSCGTYFGYLGD